MNPSTTLETRWENRWISAESTFDPAYERTNAALRRWVDGMEQALLARATCRRAGLVPPFTSSQIPDRR